MSVYLCMYICCVLISVLFFTVCSRRLRSRVVSLDFYKINIYFYYEEGKENKERRIGSVYRVSACI